MLCTMVDVYGKVTHCFARPTGGSLQTVRLYILGEDADIKLLCAIVGNPAHLLYQ